MAEDFGTQTEMRQLKTSRAIRSGIAGRPRLDHWRVVMLKSFIAFCLSFVLLAGFVGCGGPGNATTISREDRPANLRDDTGGTKIGPGGNELPPGVLSTEEKDR